MPLRFEQYPKASAESPLRLLGITLVVGTEHIGPVMEFHAEHKADRQHIPHQGTPSVTDER